MAEATLTIGGRRHLVTCRDGEEPRLQQLAGMIDARWPAASRAAGAGSERAMMFAALMLADALLDAENGGPAAEATLIRVADQLDAITAALEAGGGNA